MRVLTAILFLLAPMAAQAADLEVVRPRPLLVYGEQRLPALGPYACTALQLRNHCRNWANSSSHWGLSDGIATCTCSRLP